MRNQNLSLMTGHGLGHIISQGPIAQPHSKMERLGTIFQYQAQTKRAPPRLGITKALQKAMILMYVLNQDLIWCLHLVSYF